MNAHETHQEGQQGATPAGVASVRRAALRLNVGLTDASDTADILAVLDDLDAAEARAALLEGLLRKTLSAFSEGEQWWRGHPGRCSETCPDNHRCCALYAEALSALADGG